MEILICLNPLDIRNKNWFIDDIFHGYEIHNGDESQLMTQVHPKHIIITYAEVI
jgi:hypothetical protein